MILKNMKEILALLTLFLPVGAVHSDASSSIHSDGDRSISQFQYYNKLQQHLQTSLGRFGRQMS